jgi:signal transduction histidine kinase/ActR/RegA family two-component response regulator
MHPPDRPSGPPIDWLERIDIPAVVYRLDGTFDFFNAAAEQVLPRPRTDFVGTHDAVHHGDSIGPWEECFLRVARGESTSERTRVHHKGRGYESRFFRIGDRVLVLFREITAELRADAVRDRLMSLVESLSGSMSTDQMVRALLTTGTQLFDATTATIAFVDDDGTHVRIIDQVGIETEGVAPYRRMPLSAPLPGSDVIRTGEPLFLPSLDERARLYPHLAAEPDRRQAYAILPLRVHDTVYGFVAFGFERPNPFTAEDRAMMTTVARHCALVIERTRLREREAAALAQQSAHVQRTRALAESSQVFAEAAAQRQPERRICELLVERIHLLLGSGVAVRILRDDGLLETVAWDNGDPAHRQLLSPIYDTPQPADEGLSGQALRENRLLVLPVIGDIAGTLPPAHARALLGMGLHSLIVAPLRVDGRPIGVFIVGRSRHDQGSFSGDDAALVQEIGDRASLTITAIRAREAAEVGAAHVRLLHGLNTHLAQAFTVGEVAAVAVAAARDALRAEAAFVATLVPGESLLRLVHASGYADDVVARLRAIPLSSPSAIALAVTTRTPVFFESPAQVAARFPENLATVHASGLAAGACTPLAGKAGVVGALGINYWAPHAFTAAERELAEAIAAATGQALERAALYEREYHARQALERAAGRLHRMHAVAAALVGALTENDVVRIVIEEGTRAFGAQGGAVYLPRGDADLELVDVSGLGARLRERYRRVPVSADLPLCIVYRTGQALWLERGEDLRRPHTTSDEMSRLTQTEAVAALPLSVDGRIVGAMGFGFAQERVFLPEDRELGFTLASLAAAALDRVRLYHEAEAARQAAEAASQAKDEFLAMLGHELRNPLAPIATALELMSLKLGDLAHKERAVIARQVSHLTRLVGDLLDVSRITRGKITLHRAPIELARVVAMAIERVSPLLEEKQHALAVDVPPRGLVIEADEDRLCQIVTNLLTNAARYTDRGGHIAIRARVAGDAVELVVQDDGVGIEPQLLPRIFELFVQGTRSLDRREGGLGLGLAVVERLVALHGGSVHVHSDGSGEGSAFTIRLPLARVPAAQPAPRDPAPAPAPASPRRLRVLVVDDNQDAAELVAHALEAQGHETRVVFDGLSAIKHASEGWPDVVLLDIGLPVMDGYETARRLRALPGAAALRLIALTGYGQESDRRRTREAGFDEHLTKPTPLPQLLEAVARQPAGDV